MSLKASRCSAGFAAASSRDDRAGDGADIALAAAQRQAVLAREGFATEFAG